MEHLERDRPVVPQILGQIDRRHPPTTKLALDRIAAVETFTKSQRQLAQGALPVRI